MFTLLPALVSLLAASVPVITPAEAAKHVGQEVIVQGTIDQIALSVNLTTHINFGGRYPNHAFTATIFKAKQALFTGVKGYEGQEVQVQGVVHLYRGKPEIVLDQPSQLRAAGGGAPAPASASTSAPDGRLVSEIAALRFDPQGADFDAWVGHFKHAITQEWIMPEEAESGTRGTVDFELVIEKDGSMSAARMKKSSGTSSLDRAAANALAKSRFLPLPEAYPQANLVLQVSLAYGEVRK